MLPATISKSKKLGLTVAFLLGTTALLQSCKAGQNPAQGKKDYRMDYPNLLNVVYTPNSGRLQGQGMFTDMGSWMGFTIPARGASYNGFCGPFDLDNRTWVSESVFKLSALNKNRQELVYKPDTAIYYPGKLLMKSSSGLEKLDQALVFITANHALLKCSSAKDVYFKLEGSLSGPMVWTRQGNSLLSTLKKGEIIMLSFPGNVSLDVSGKAYTASSKNCVRQLNVVVSYFNSSEEHSRRKAEAAGILKRANEKFDANSNRWNGYIRANLRSDMPLKNNKVMVKSIMTLISNWRSPKGALYHAGLVPSHAMDYFVGFWAWDSWKHAVALSSIDNKLAKDQMRTMFDYQDETGMIADCIYTDSAENNYRDSKPPLAAWAVDAIYKADGDKAFLKEMYPKLLKYYQWWYTYRDHDKNGICEYGATDGTLEAAKWESGMDNAIRFDRTMMLKNSPNAWSMDQESVDLNAYLHLEYELLKKFAKVLSVPFKEIDRKAVLQNYFFSNRNGYFFDKTLKGDFIEVYGPEGWTPLWTGLANKQQAERVAKIMFDPKKFSTYIPFPTAAADNPKFNSRGYWRGPIWLDQVYFAIAGLRKYGYTQEADTYTRQVFGRLKGLDGDAPIHENYDVHTGERLKASHFSWSAAHLFLMYKEMGKK